MLLFLVSASTMAAQKTGLSARELYYQAVAPATQSGGTKAGTAATGGARPKTDKPKSAGDEGTTKIPVTPVSTQVARRLGLRYNLLKIDRDTRASESVDPDANFAANDCLALQLTPNRNVRLFIFNRAASGTWKPLMPSPELPEENNLVSAGSNVQVPQNYCFQIDDTHGTERMLVILSERNEDFDQLNREMEQLIPAGGRKAPEPAPKSRTQIAAGKGHPLLNSKPGSPTVICGLRRLRNPRQRENSLMPFMLSRRPPIRID